jgi:hypothetical protein
LSSTDEQHVIVLQFNKLRATTLRQPDEVTALLQLVDNLATRLLSPTDLLQVVPTTCYRSAIQQFANKL